MPKFRAKLSLTLVTKPVIIDAPDFKAAEEVFRNLSVNDLFTVTDSLNVMVVEQVVRVLDSEPLSFEPEAKKLPGRKGKERHP